MISGGVAGSMLALVTKLEADADRAEAAAPGVIANLWGSIIGAESSASGATHLARAARRDADRFRERYASLVNDPSASDAEGRRFIADAQASYGVAGGSAGYVEAATGLLSPVSAVVETAKGTIADIRAALPVAAWGAIGIGAVVLAVVVYSRGRK